MRCRSGLNLRLPKRFLLTSTNAGAGGESVARPGVGEIVGTKSRKKLTILAAAMAMIGLSLSSGCGSGSGANVITVSVTSTSTSLIVGQSATLTATVSGATNTSVKWTPEFVSGAPPCQYTITPTTSNTTGPVTSCPTDGSLGTLTNLQDTGASPTATYTAPATLPDPNTYPDLVIIITAESQQNTNKTGKIDLKIISGITVTLTPTTASVPTGEPQQFSVLLTNDLKSQGVTWAITQQIPGLNPSTSTTSTPPNPYSGLATCSPTCGTITPSTSSNNVAIYTAPTSLPTVIFPAQKNNTNAATQVTIVATSVADDTAIATGTITIVQGGPITFNGITPTIAPLGATFWDIYLDAPFISSASTITLTDSQGGTTQKLSSSGQVKILFPLPTTSTTTTNGVTTTTTVTGSPTGARLRLLSSDLQLPGPVTISISDPAQPCNGIPAGTSCTATGTGTYDIIPVRPSTISSSPDDVIQGAFGEDTPVTIDGGYFGPASSGNPLVNVTFQNNTLPINVNSSSSSLLNVTFLKSFTNSASPGLYPLSVASKATPLPSPSNPAVTNISIFPDYSSTPPAVVSGQNGIPAGTNPSAVDLDPILGVLVVAETGSNAVQFYQIGAGSLTPIDSTGTVCAAGCPVAVGNVPTGLSVNRTNHTVAIVSYGSQTTATTNSVCQISTLAGQSVTVLNIPGNPSPITPFSVDLTGALQGSVCPAPMPYSIGVDPDSNLALVAYSSITSSSFANLGFIVNLNSNIQGSSGNLTNPCALGLAINPASNQFGQCLYAQVTLNTGQYPQIATTSHGHTAIVTPGGSGVVRGVDVTSHSSANVITSATLTAGLVTVTIDTTQCPPGVPPTAPASSTNPCPLLMVPGNAGTVLITGLPKGSNGTNFNGAYTVSVLSSNTFVYALQSTVTDTSAGSCNPTANPPTCSTVFYGTPNQIFSISPTLQGIAINPITNTAALADANSTGTNGAQIDLLNALDQSISSITLSSNCTAFITPCATSAELLATTDVAWQPYTNEVVSYNPHLNQVSISDPTSRLRYAFVCNTNTPASMPIPSGTCVTDPTTPQQQQTFQSQIVLNGTGTATLNVQNGTPNSNTLNLFGGLAVDPTTNQAFVVKSGSGTIDIVDLGGPGTATPIKPTHISEIIVPSPTPGLGLIGGIPNASVPQATLTSTTAVSGVQLFGSGFAAGMQVLLDGVDITTKGGTIDTIAPNGRQASITIPPAFLSAPHHYSLVVVSNGVTSNSVDFIVIQAIDMSTLCTDSNGNPVNSMPTSVAIADQLANGPFSPIAVITNQGCNSISIIDINPADLTFGQFIGSPNALIVGTAPQGIAISQRRGLAVVANNGSSSASIIDLTQNPPVKAVPDVNTGTNPVGVAINDPTGVAITANFGSNTITALNFGLLFPPAGTAPATTLSPVSIGGIQDPLAVAIDPDRGSNNQGIAVVTSVQLSSGSAPIGALSVVEIGFVTPSLSTTISAGSVSATPTGIVFDPAVVTGTANPGVFFANSSGTNTISEFNPDTGSGSTVSVGINPTSLDVNPQTGGLLTSNSLSNTASVVDIGSNPFKTHQTLGLPGSGTFGVAIDQFTNLAVIVDQANQRVFLFPMPN